MTRRCVVHRVTVERYLGYVLLPCLGIYLEATECLPEALCVVYVIEQWFYGCGIGQQIG